MGVKFLEHTTYGILHEFLLVNRVDIEVADSQFGYLQLLEWVHTLRESGCAQQQ